MLRDKVQTETTVSPVLLVHMPQPVQRGEDVGIVLRKSDPKNNASKKSYSRDSDKAAYEAEGQMSFDWGGTDQNPRKGNSNN
jgi:hypothetical protein